MKKIKKGMTYYKLSGSQEQNMLLLQYSIHKQVSQIPFLLLINRKLNLNLLKKAVIIEVDRNDAMRLFFSKKEGKYVQYFIDHVDTVNIPITIVDFTGKTKEEQDEFLGKDASIPIHFKKDETYRIYLIHSYDGRTGIFINVFHMNMDAYGVFITFSDILKVYDSLEKGIEMPEPMTRFETALKRELEYMADEKKMNVDKKFFTEFFLKDGEPFYAAVHGSDLLHEKRLKKKKPNLRYLNVFDPIHDKSANLHFHLPAEKFNSYVKFCEENNISPDSLIQMGMRTYLSKINDLTDDVTFLNLCFKRALKDEKKCSGCLTHAIEHRSVISKEKTFIESLRQIIEIKFNLYRHLNYPANSVFNIVTKLYNQLPGDNYPSMLYTFLPSFNDYPEGYKCEVTGYNPTRFSFPLYTLAVINDFIGGLDFYFAYLTYRITPEHVNALYFNTIKVIDAGIADPNIKINELLNHIL